MTAKDYPVTFKNGIIIDPEDVEKVKAGGGLEIMTNGYASLVTGRRKTRKRIYLHRFIINAPKTKQVDHINRNKLDNRKSNLRLVTCQQNSQNTGFRKHNTSGYMGVLWHKQKNKWWARLTVNKKSISLGLFEDLEDAASCRYAAETQLLGEFAPNA